jgi:hypothetical protein
MPETDATRTDPAGSQKFRIPLDDDECAGFEGATARLRAGSSLHGRPCRPIKVAQQLTAATIAAGPGVDLPAYGSGLYAAVTNSGTATVTLPSGVDNTWFDASGMLNVPWTIGHASEGQGRLVTSYVTSTRVGTLERLFGTAPTTSQAFRNLIDCRWYSKLRVKVELSHDAALGQLQVILFGWPKGRANELAGSTTVKRPVRMGDYTLPLESLGDQADTLETGYWNGRMLEMDCDGMYGALLRVKSLSTGHSVSLWVAPS